MTTIIGGRRIHPVTPIGRGGGTGEPERAATRAKALFDSLSLWERARVKVARPPTRE